MPVGPELGSGRGTSDGSSDGTTGPSPAAGWYPDPGGAGDRWWTGQAWSDGDRDRPTPVATSTNRPAVAPMPADSYLATPSSSPAQNKAATVGLVLGIVSLVVNPVLLVGLGALVASGIALNRASLMGQHGYSSVGRARALGGIALALAGTALSVVFKNALL